MHEQQPAAFDERENTAAFESASADPPDGDRDGVHWPAALPPLATHPRRPPPVVASRPPGAQRQPSPLGRREGPQGATGGPAPSSSADISCRCAIIAELTVLQERSLELSRQLMSLQAVSPAETQPPSVQQTPQPFAQLASYASLRGGGAPAGSPTALPMSSFATRSRINRSKAAPSIVASRAGSSNASSGVAQPRRRRTPPANVRDCAVPEVSSSDDGGDAEVASASSFNAAGHKRQQQHRSQVDADSRWRGNAAVAGCLRQQEVMRRRLFGAKQHQSVAGGETATTSAAVGGGGSATNPLVASDALSVGSDGDLGDKLDSSPMNGRRAGARVVGSLGRLHSDGGFQSPRELSPTAGGGVPVALEGEVESASDSTSQHLHSHHHQHSAANDGLPESHPLVIGADALYIVASVAAWGAAVAGLTLTHGASRVQTQSELHEVFAIVIAVAHVVSIVWAASRFFVQTRTGPWDLACTKREIRAYYRRSRWFVFDVVCAVPFDFLFWFWSPTAFFAVELRQFVRAARFASLVKSSNPLQGSRQWVQLAIFCLTTTFMVHAVTCVFQHLNAGDTYIRALYLTSSTLSSVGYGDVVPNSDDGSRLFGISIMYVGLAVVAAATAFATSLLTSQNAVEAKAREKKKLLASMLDHFSIPWHEQIEIMSLFPTALDAENVRSFTELVQGMPPFIVERVEAYTRAKALAGAIPLFSELPMAVVLELAGRLQQRVCQANEVLIGAGAVNREMLFLVRGAADVVVAVSEAEEAVVTVLRAGMYFGELGLVRDEAADASVISAVPCELLALARPDYDELTAVHPTLRELFLREVLVAIPDSDTLPAAVKAATQPAHDESLNRSDATDAGGASPPPPPQQAVSGPATAAVPSIPSFGSQSSSGASDERVAADLVAGPLSDDEAVAYQPPLVRAPSESDIDAGRLRRGDNDNDNDNDNDTGGGDSNEDLVNFAARSGIMTLGWEPPTPNQPLQVSPYASRTQLLQSDDGTVPVVAPE